MHASRTLGHASAVRLWLLADAARVLVIVWDASPHRPVRAEARPEAENIERRGGWNQCGVP